MINESTELLDECGNLPNTLSSCIRKLSANQITIIACTLIASSAALIAYLGVSGRNISLGNGMIEIT